MNTAEYNVNANQFEDFRHFETWSQTVFGSIQCVKAWKDLSAWGEAIIYFDGYNVVAE